MVERMPLHPKIQGLIPAAAADGTVRGKMAKRLYEIGERFVRNRHFSPRIIFEDKLR